MVASSASAQEAVPGHAVVLLPWLVVCEVDHLHLLPPIGDQATLLIMLQHVSWVVPFWGQGQPAVHYCISWDPLAGKRT